jgi:hypothetical protein
MSNIEGRLTKVLLSKPTVTTRAVFWKIPHNTKKEDICLKLGRYKKSGFFGENEEPESQQPKSELTLNHDEFQSLIEFLQQSYEPFRQGVKAFIPLERSLSGILCVRHTMKSERSRYATQEEGGAGG